MARIIFDRLSQRVLGLGKKVWIRHLVRVVVALASRQPSAEIAAEQGASLISARFGKVERVTSTRSGRVEVNARHLARAEI
jgi:hypothetical protein